MSVRRRSAVRCDEPGRGDVDTLECRGRGRRVSSLTTRTYIGIMYKPTLFDRYGPDAGNIVRALSYAGVVFGLTVVLFSAASLKLEPPLPFGWTIVWILCGSTGSSALACLAGLAVSSTSGALVKRVALDGASTPYSEQYSYQQALVMQGRIDDALASFEAVIAEKPRVNDAGRAVSELRRLVDRYPCSPAADHARAALATLKAKLHADA